MLTVRQHILQVSSYFSLLRAIEMYTLCLSVEKLKAFQR